MNKRHLLRLAAAGLVAIFSAQASAAPSVSVQGVVVSRATNSPAPGLKVFLVHRDLGRSAASYTDAYGRFGWSAIPISAEPFYVEIYWGDVLVYRQSVQVTAPTELSPITI